MAKPQEKDVDEKDSFVDELKPGTKLMHGQYTIENFLNAGGFGITYLARDSLDRKIVIKECFPGAFCRRSRYIVQARSRAHQNELKSIVRLFVQEARSLAKLDHPNIVGVHQVFEDNDTAYMALDFVEGRDLLDTIEDPNHGLTPVQIKSILKEVLGAVGFIHDQGILHRDISPDNILINKEFHPVLIDFGAAREEATKQSRVLSALRVVKDGYSPQEFYIAGSEQSPSSDLYALAASFHHLIADDVPPNSQARLAAIATGDQDPYKPLAGRFPDYDDKFLGALDKALAVLPKDRVQSAKEWIAIMDGVEGNVTPLNVTGASATEAAATAAAEPKSNMPLLLGSAAAIALLVGVGVMSMSGGEDAPAPQTSTQTQAPVATPTPTAEAATSETSETVAAVEEEASVPAFLQEATPETPIAEAPVVEVPAAEAPAVEEPVAEPVVEEPVAEPVVEEPAIAALITPTPAPTIATEPVAPVTEQIADAPALVEGPTDTDTLTPSVRPAVRPESVEIAALPEPEPLPEPVVTPRPAVAEPVDSAEFPDQSANRPFADTETAEVALPATPENVAEIGAGPEVEIAAVTPGNELLPDLSDSLSASWTVQLPFVATGVTSNVIAEAGPVSPVWVQPGLVITEVNGTTVESITQIAGVLRQQTGEEELAPTIPVTFGTFNPTSGESVDHQWVLPVVQELGLSNGISFRTGFSGSEWVTTVAAMPSVQSGGLQVGDVIRSFIPTSEIVNDRDTLLSIFNRELGNGTDQFQFAVQRDGSLWVASLTYTGVVE